MEANSDWWNQQHASNVLSGPELIRQWKIQTFGAEEPSAQQLQSLADLSIQLWNKFNTNRATLDRDYMSDEKSLSAYMASFLLPNIERVRTVMTYPKMIEKVRSLSELETIDVLDFGAGPLSASTGFLLALNQAINLSGTSTVKIKKIRITAIERSEKAVKRAQNLIQKSLRPEIELELDRVTAIPADRAFYVILAANVMNEIPEKHRWKVVSSLLKSMIQNPLGIAVIVEPGQEEHSKNLAAMRDAIFDGAMGDQFELLAPCPHKNACPLGPKSKRRDWCWFKTEFARPLILMELDRRTKLDHAQLAFSWLALSHNSTTGISEQKNPLAVSVSDEMPVGNINDAAKRLEYFKNNLISETHSETPELLEKIARSGHKTMLCMPTGQLAGGLRLRKESDNKIKRGFETEPSTTFSLLVTER
ncbi:MAG: hypothetical protein RI953_120 [Pseudomonadota bacterium]